ncbi:DUF5302 domain-containing protein [Mycolicibacterium hippocampi]|jgi:hypothetical protein|uniref:DUF5302 domain-containing protein n=1 Tax=Mycolicibacterium hippocampi TaxID=659824 RepID=A0A850PPT0_9MYCO|nr:DUF5302 domain-containing protein [Mycolicibacterium hippocampi]NVN49656.1 hypothetical protein [Mycolicibacterium hippocampi]
MASKGSAESAESSESAEDDTKRKFREALERKKAKSAEGSSHTDGGLKKPRAHGPVENRREFRRKSG